MALHGSMTAWLLISPGLVDTLLPLCYRALQAEKERGQGINVLKLKEERPRRAPSILFRKKESAVISIFQKCFKKGTVVNRRQGHGWQRLIDALGERRLACVVRSNR